MDFPCFLVALPQMQDDFFGQAVVLLSHQDTEGAFGIVINKPLEATDEKDNPSGEKIGVVAELRDPTGEKVYEIHDNLFRGGPAEDNSMFVLHEDENLADGGTRLSDHLFLSTNPSVFESLLDLGDKSPRKRFFLGCSAWAKGQLESEIRAGSWVILPFNESLALEDIDTTAAEPWSIRLWRKVLLAGGLDPLTLVSQGKSDTGYN